MTKQLKINDMKKSITFLMLIVAFYSTAQEKPIESINYSYSDALRTSSFSFSVSGAAYLATYEGLWQFTDIKPSKCKLIAIGSSIIVNNLVIFTQKKATENNGYTFDNKNILYSEGFGLIASFSMPILWGKETRNRNKSLKNRRKLNNLNKYYNF